MQDPAPLLMFLTEKITSSSSYVLLIEKLQSDLQHYEEEFQCLKNQDITIRKLEEQIQEFKFNNNEKIMEELTKHQQELDLEAEQKISHCYSLQQIAEKRLSVAQDSLKAARLNAEKAQSQLYEVSIHAEARISDLTRENSNLVESVDRLEARLVELEAINQNLSAKLLQSGGVSQSALAVNLQANDERFNTQTLQLVINDLRLELKKKTEIYRTELKSYEQTTKELNQLLTREKEQVFISFLDLNFQL
jgi:hypothetical protein